MGAQDMLFGGALEFGLDLPQELRDSRPVRVLGESFAKGRLPHAMLLHGEDLEALERVALSLSKALLGATGSVSDHPDLLTLRPSGKARQIKVGERSDASENTMRRFMRDIHQTANQGGRKVAMVVEADRMNPSTTNAFLKTLEEPPPDTIILLLTTRPYDLLDTIRSRCFSFKIQASGSSLLEDERWVGWVASYREWLSAVAQAPRDPREVANAVLGLYGLVARFESVLKGLADAAWKREKAAGSNLSDEQQLAQEAGIRKGVRQRLFAQIEQTTRDWALAAGPDQAGRPLARTIEDLEHAFRLCEVFNLREDAALEVFLLDSLRTWAAA